MTSTSHSHDLDHSDRSRTFIAAASAVIASGLSLFELAKWISGGYDVSQLSVVELPMSAHTAVIVLFCAITLALVNSSAKPVAGIFFCLFIGLLIIEALYNFDLFPGNTLHVLGLILPPYEFTEKTMAPNGIMSLGLLAIALFFLLQPVRASYVNAANAVVFALLGMSIGGLAIYGHLGGTEAAYWWRSDVPLAFKSGCAVLVLGIGIIAVAWEHFTSPLTKLPEILWGIRFISAAVLLITVFLSACTTILPLYETLLNKIYEQVKSGVEDKSSELSQFLSSFRMTVEAVAVKGEGPLGAQPGGSNQTLAAAMGDALRHTKKQFPGVSSVTFLALNEGEPQKEAAQPEVVVKDEDEKFNTQPTLLLEQTKDGKVQAFVDVAFRPALGRPRRLARLELDSEHLTTLLLHDLPPAVSEGTFYLIAKSPGGPLSVVRLSSADRILELISPDEIPGELRRVFSRNYPPGLNPSRLLLRSDHISFLAPLEGISAYLGFASKVSQLRAVFREQLAQVLVGLCSLVVISTGLIFFLTRKLTRQIILLDWRLQKSIVQIGEELSLRKQVQADVEKSLQEKEVLLKEVHHRVKNNLQVISSIINLQLRRSRSDDAAATLRESSNRIQSIALLHDTLYRSENFSQILLEDYFSELTKYLSSSYEIGQRVEVVIQTHGVSLEIDRAIPLGLILTELLTNSFKYAFELEGNGEGPRVQIDTEYQPNGDLLFLFSDNGRGLPDDFSLEGSHSLGSRLVAILSHQLKGEIVFHSAGGAHFVIRIPPVIKEKERHYEQAANTDR